MRTLETLPWSRGFAELPAAGAVPVAIAPLAGARLLLASPAAGALLGLGADELARPELVAYANGERPWPGAEPVATDYAGHQFGVFVPRLGDGRACLLGEVRGTDDGPWEVQVKGCGPTPFSRGFDGRAVARSCLRELLASEAMAGLGLPTTRALCVVAGETPVAREEPERGALLVRLAPSHARIGTLERWATAGDLGRVAALVDWVLARHLPEACAALGPARAPVADPGLGGDVGRADAPGPEVRAARAEALLEAVAVRTGRLVAAWQAVGFAHGVLNTDNLSLLGLTLDYGPFGFVERYDPGWVCNASDHGGRYALDRQPEAGLFGLACLARALEAWVPRGRAEAALDAFADAYRAEYTARMAAKLGLAGWREGDDGLLLELLELLARERVDWTAFWRALADHEPGALRRGCAGLAGGDPADAGRGPCAGLAAAGAGRGGAGPAGGEPSVDPRGGPGAMRALFTDPAAPEPWLRRHAARLATEARSPAARRAAMRGASPRFVLRRGLAQAAIEAWERHGDAAPAARLLRVLARPFDDHPDADDLAAPPPAGAPTLRVSCSS